MSNVTLEELADQVAEIKRQTGFRDLHAEAVAEHKSLCERAREHEKDAVAAVKRFAWLFQNWGRRAEEAAKKLPRPADSMDLVAVRSQLAGAKKQLAAIPETWARIRSALKAEAALQNLAAIRQQIDAARRQTSDLVVLRDGIRRLVANIEHVATLAEE